ncbi:hypothetical protein PIB30_107362, partial [Stylosanthes scabra]|nr:hypothetical protein [Stylosanthes scabra]
EDHPQELRRRGLRGGRGGGAGIADRQAHDRRLRRQQYSLPNVTIKILVKVIEYCKNTSRLQTLKKSPTRKKLWACWQLVKAALSPDRIAAWEYIGSAWACSRRTQRSFSLLVEYNGSALHLSPCTRFILVRTRIISIL